MGEKLDIERFVATLIGILGRKPIFTAISHSELYDVLDAALEAQGLTCKDGEIIEKDDEKPKRKFKVGDVVVHRLDPDRWPLTIKALGEFGYDLVESSGSEIIGYESEDDWELYDVPKPVKFKVGDLVVRKDGRCISNRVYVARIKEVRQLQNFQKKLSFGTDTLVLLSNGVEIDFSKFVTEYRHFTLDDANDIAREQPKWKHWTKGICGNSEGKQIYLVKRDGVYFVSSALDFECDYLEISELEKLPKLV